MSHCIYKALYSTAQSMKTKLLPVSCIVWFFGTLHSSPNLQLSIGCLVTYKKLTTRLCWNIICHMGACFLLWLLHGNKSVRYQCSSTEVFFQFGCRKVAEGKTVFLHWRQIINAHAKLGSGNECLE